MLETHKMNNKLISGQNKQLLLNQKQARRQHHA